MWSIACLVVRRGFRERHLICDLVRAAIQGYPMLTGSAKVIWDEFNVGPVGAFAAEGFDQMSHPTTRRVVMRLDL